METRLYDEAIQREDLEMLNSLWNRGLTFDDFSASKAICAKDPEIRDWVLGKKYHPDFLTYLFAIRRKRFDVLEWLYITGIECTSVLADFAVIQNNVLLMEWFESKGIYPTKIGIQYAILNNFKELLTWFQIRKLIP